MSFVGQAASCVYEGVSAVATSSLVKAGGKVIGCAIGQQAVNSMGVWLGQKGSSLTGGRLTVSNLVPETVKAPFRNLGDFLLMKVTAPLSDKIHIPQWITRHIPYNDYNPASHSVIACPMVEELVFRLPLVVIFSQIDNTEMLNSALFTVGDMGCTAGDVAKLATVLFSAVGFTYSHERSSGVNPHNPGRAMGLLASGIGYAVIATQLDFQTALMAHAVYNLSSYFLS